MPGAADFHLYTVKKLLPWNGTGEMNVSVSEMGLPAVLSITGTASHRTAIEWLAALVIVAAASAPVVWKKVRAARRTDSAHTPCPYAEKFCEFALQATQMDMQCEPGPQLATILRTVFDLDAVAIFDADLHKVYPIGAWFSDPENMVRNTYLFETAQDEPEIGLTRRVLHIGGLPIGALLLRGEVTSALGNSIACMVSITFDRYHSHINASRTESARQSEQFRTMVLDNLAHAYKTPLTAIRAASTGLHEMGHLSATQMELVSLIEEQADALSDLTTRLLKTAQLESTALTPQWEPVAIAPLIDDVLASLQDERHNSPTQVIVLPEELSLCCDRDLLVALLTQYIDNAGKYAYSRSTITVMAAQQPDKVVFSVHNMGPTIPPSDQERIFDRYFRSPASSESAPGSGIGLSVARHAAEAHGGSVWVTSDPHLGTTFFAALPLARPEGIQT
jgi:two-component system sensor histidine kinase KdpD